MYSSPPLIFIHYGPAPYLRWTLQQARISNPHKRIILLGDEKNRSFARGIADFFPFKDYEKGKALQKFESVFQVIQGRQHCYTKEGGVETWLKFVFRRWFLINEFLKSQSINSFWTFDSDTLIWEPLDKIQARFTSFEGTTQCRGKCLNGWVGSQQLVERYVHCINELFNDTAYLEQQRERLHYEITNSFNEMDAFSEFCRREKIYTCRAAKVIGGETFDDALAIIDEYELAPKKILGRSQIKRLWVSSDGKFYIRRVADHQMVRLLTCNMSWMPDFFWKRLIKLAATSFQGSKKNEPMYKEVSLEPPLFSKVKKFLRLS